MGRNVNVECESEPVHSVVWYNVCQSEHVHSLVYYNRFILWLSTFLTKSERLHYNYGREYGI
jgi:hypothetical protein